LRRYDNLPKSLRDQIFDDDNYDIFGINSGAYDDYTFIDAPIGSAAADYKSWLDANPEIAKEIERTIFKNAADKGVTLVPTTYDYFGDIGTKDGTGGLVPYYDFNLNNPTDNTPTVWENPEG